MSNFINLQTGQYYDECELVSFLSTIDWSCCNVDEFLFTGLGQVKTGWQWYEYFLLNPPPCSPAAPSCSFFFISGGSQPGDAILIQGTGAIGFPAPTNTYSFEINDGLGWILLATGTSYTIQPGDVGSQIRGRCNSSNTEGAVDCYTAPFLVLPANQSPTNTLAPVISGGTNEGDILTCSTGTFSGYPAVFTHSFQWYINGIPVPSQNESTYKIKLSDSTKIISCSVTADNGIGMPAVAFAPGVTAGNFGPVNTLAPSITGGTSLNSVLNCNPGTWDGQYVELSYQWYSNGVAVGNDSQQYQLKLTDSLHSMTCVVTGKNAYGQNAIVSNTIIAGNFAPVNTIAPALSVVGGGSPEVGSLLKCTTGTWAGTQNLQFSYQFYSGVNPVTGNGDEYEVQPADSGQAIYCVVSATSQGGVGTSNSNTLIISAGPVVTPPSCIMAPTISVQGGGFPVDGADLVVDIGLWDGTSPIDYDIEWYSGAVLVSITSSYQIQQSDEGNTIVCYVNGTNAYGVDTAASNSIVALAKPYSTTAPTISGALPVGSLLTCNPGTFGGSGTITPSYQWLINGQPIPGANAATYTTQSTDLGEPIKCQVTGTSLYGIVIVESNTLIPTKAPTIGVSSVIYGSNTIGSILTMNPGTWLGYPTPIVTTKWQYSVDGGLNYIDFSPAVTGPTYQITAGDLNRLIRGMETAVNSEGTSFGYTNDIDTTPAGTAPAISGSISVSGVKIVSRTLTADVSGLTISGNPTPTRTYQWFRGTSAIPGASGTLSVGVNTFTYTLQAADSGESIYARVYATNVNGVAQIDSSIQSIVLTIGDKYPTGLRHAFFPFLVRGAYYNQPFIRIRRASDNATLDISHDANGYINEAAISAHGGASACFLLGFYCQVTGTYVEQTTANNQLRVYTGSAIERLPATTGRICFAPNGIQGGFYIWPGSQAAGTFNFLHNGLFNAVTYFVEGASTSGASAWIFTTKNGTGVAIGADLTWNNSNRLVANVSNNSAYIVNNQSAANVTTTDAQTLVTAIFRPGNAQATLRSQLIANGNGSSNNTSSGTPNTGNHTNNAQYGNSTYQNRKQGFLMYADDTFRAQIELLIRQQFNF